MLILLLLTTFSGLGLEVYLKANAENRMVKRETQSRQALYIAEGGIEWAKAHLRVLIQDYEELSEGDLSLETEQGDIDVDIEIKIDPSGEGFIVISEGRSGLAMRKIEQILQFDNGKWIMKSYQELHS